MRTIIKNVEDMKALVDALNGVEMDIVDIYSEDYPIIVSVEDGKLIIDANVESVDNVIEELQANINIGDIVFQIGLDGKSISHKVNEVSLNDVRFLNKLGLIFRSDEDLQEWIQERLREYDNE